jgi:hypothetical protein
MRSGDRAPLDRVPAERFGFEGVVGERFDHFVVVAVDASEVVLDATLRLLTELWDCAERLTS